MKMRETVESYANDYREMGYDVLFTSINTSESIDILKPFLEGCVSVVAGNLVLENLLCLTSYVQN